MRDIFNSYTLTELRKIATGYNKNVKITGVHKKNKTELINELMKHTQHFKSLKMKDKKPKRPLKEVKPKITPKPTPVKATPIKKAAPKPTLKKPSVEEKEFKIPSFMETGGGTMTYDMRGVKGTKEARNESIKYYINNKLYEYFNKNPPKDKFEKQKKELAKQISEDITYQMKHCQRNIKMLKLSIAFMERKIKLYNFKLGLPINYIALNTHSGKDILTRFNQQLKEKCYNDNVFKLITNPKYNLITNTNIKNKMEEERELIKKFNKLYKSRK